jgi:hypothetical protein
MLLLASSLARHNISPNLMVIILQCCRNFCHQWLQSVWCDHDICTNLLLLLPLLCMLQCLLQMCGVALATAGFIIATKDFEVPFKEVLMHHDTLGVAILVLVYVQV